MLAARANTLRCCSPYRRSLGRAISCPGAICDVRPSVPVMGDSDPAVVRQHLQKVLASQPMEKSEASQKLLRYLAERSLRDETPKETEIAIDVFGRDASFNSAEESLV